MNEIKVSVNFKTGKCIVHGYNPIDNDYNASKLVFNFDENYEGRKVVEIRPAYEATKDATFSSEIINNEVILSRLIDGEYRSVFTKPGNHIIEVHLYNNNSKLTAISSKYFKVEEEQINIGDEQATVYLPVFDQMIQELDSGLDDLSSGLNSLNEAITETNNLNIDISKQGKTSTIELTKKDGTTKSVNVNDGTDGRDGIDGYTPIKGVDYYTEEEKQELIDYVIDDSTSAFNQNATEKTTTFNSNASSKLEEYNTNATSKVSDYNENAQDKIDEYDEHVEETQETINDLQSEVDDLRRNQKQDTANGTNIYVDDAFDTRIMESRMSKESTQETTTGKNKLASIVNASASDNGINLTNDNGIYTIKGNTTTSGSNITRNLLNEYEIQNGDYLHIGNNVANSSISIALLYNGTQITSPSMSIANRIFDLSSFAGSKINQLRFYTAANSTIDMVVKPMICNTSTATDFEKYTGEQTSPNSLFPSEVKTVKGYRNLFDKDNANIINGFFDAGNITSSSTAKIIYTQCETNTIYTMSKIVSARFQLAYSTAIPTIAGNVLGTIVNNTANSITITTGDNAQYLVAYIYSSSDTLSFEQILDSIMITEGTEALPYVPYGNNYVYTKVVGKNLYDKNNVTNGYLNNSGNIVTTDQFKTSDYIKLNKNKNSLMITGNAGRSELNCFYDENKNFLSTFGMGTSSSLNVSIPTNACYLRTTTYKDNLDVYMIEYGTTATSYESYKETIVPIPLNGNEIAGIGDYKDELIVDSKGKCWLNKKIGKDILDGSESGWSIDNSNQRAVYSRLSNVMLKPLSDNVPINALCNLLIVKSLASVFSNKEQGLASSLTGNLSVHINNLTDSGNLTLSEWLTFLSLHNMVLYYTIATPQLIDLNYTVDIRLFNGVNNISNSDDMDMEIKYVQDINQIINNITNAMLEIGGN